MELEEKHIGTHNLFLYPIGILFGAGFILSEIIEIKNPNLAKPIISSPTFSFFFIGIIYFGFCVYYLHSYLRKISNEKYPISPAKAALFHLIPIYGIYWPIKWTKEIFIALNAKDEKRKILNKYGALIAVSELLFRFDAGIALILMFISITRISRIIVNEYESGNLKLFNQEQQDIGRKLIL